MDVSGAGGAAQSAQVAALMQMLKAAQDMPAEVVEKLLSVNVQNAAQAEQMKIAEQIIDIYA